MFRGNSVSTNHNPHASFFSSFIKLDEFTYLRSKNISDQSSSCFFHKFFTAILWNTSLVIVWLLLGKTSGFVFVTSKRTLLDSNNLTFLPRQFFYPFHVSYSINLVLCLVLLRDHVFWLSLVKRCIIVVSNNNSLCVAVFAKLLVIMETLY